MAGVTFSEPGNWTSWPPHEHAAMLEEAYLYIDMPAPAFGVQLVYTDAREPELATIVREGDVVLMPQGYHPNVAAPGGAINFLWMMAANREDDDRQYGVVNVHPEFAAHGVGPRHRPTEQAMNDPEPGQSRFSTRDWASIPVERIADGIERQMIWGERLMVCRLRLAPHVVTAVHSHPHEQITIVERGRVRFTVDGQERIASAGDVLHFPSHVRHGATMLDEEVVLDRHLLADPRGLPAGRPVRAEREPLVVIDLFRLDGKVALVTGASRGLGAAMAAALAEAGADVDAARQQRAARGRRQRDRPAAPAAAPRR